MAQTQTAKYPEFVNESDDAVRRVKAEESTISLAGPSPGFSSREAKNQMEGPNTRRGAHIFKYSIGCMQQPGGKT